MAAPASLGLLGAGRGATAHSPAVGASTTTSAALLPSATASPNPFSNDMPAARVIGQSGFTTSASADTAAGLDSPGAVAFDSAGDLWVVDRTNNRVLEYKAPLTTGESASVVLGQASNSTDASATSQAGFDLPSGIAFDGAGDVWVTDSYNDRVVEFVPPFYTGMNANIVLGQTSFVTATAGDTAAGMNFPFGLAFTATGDLLVSDFDNNRVLEFVPPFTDGMSASVALGQASLTTKAPAASATGLYDPAGLAIDAAGDLFVGDLRNSRVVEFTPPFTTGETESLVIGQTTFTGHAPSGATAVNITSPTGLAIDSRGDLWVADTEINRVLEFVPPFSNGMAASRVIGQSTFTTAATSTSATGLSGPLGVTLDEHGDLWVADQTHNRVLEFVPTEYPVQFGAVGLASGTSWSVTFDGARFSSTSGTISLTQSNGSYAYSVGSVAGYAESPGSGSVVVNGSGALVVFSFTSTILGLTPASFWTTVAVVLAVLVVVEAAVVVMLLVRRRRAPPRVPPTWSEGPPSAAAPSPSPPTPPPS